MKVTVQDVMSSTVVVVGKETPFKEIVHLMQEHQVGALPVADADGQAVGIVCESDLLREDPVPEGPAERRHRRMDRQRPAGLVASELMRSPVVAIGPDASLGDAARLMHRNSVDCLVVTERSGKVLGVVARPDLLKVFLRDDVEIAHEIAEDVIRRTLWIDPSAIRVAVKDGVVALTGRVERRSLVPVLVGLVEAVDGVVGIEEHVSFLIDDTSSSGLLPAG